MSSVPDSSVAPTQAQFPCGQCGAVLHFAPGAQALRCQYCGHENAIPGGDSAAAPVLERDYTTTLRELAAGADSAETPLVKCGSCGAETRRAADQTALACGFCGASIVGAAESRKRIRPDGVLPFRVERGQAEELFARWIRSLWFAPSALKRTSGPERRLRGLYMPAWTYDCLTTTHYTGQRGEHYYVTETYTATENGKPVRRTRQVRRTRWWPASGVVRNRFDDLLVLASRSMPQEKARKLEPWDLAEARSYRDEYLSGFEAESYQVDLPAGFEEAKQQMIPVIEASIRADIGGDEQQISSMRSRYDEVAFKHLLLPVWMSVYRYRGRAFRFLVNARTGEVQGERPWSRWKIAGAVVGSLLVVGAVILLIASR